MPRKFHFSTKDDVDLLRWCADRHHHHESQTNAQTRAPFPADGRVRERLTMIRSNLRVDVHDPYILVALRGTCLRAKFRKQDAPWLAMDEYEEDSEASITFKEFRNLAWQAANERARDLGWVRSCDELHEAVKSAGSAA